MTKKSRTFIAVDVLLILGMILPPVAGMVLKILTYLPSETITVTGARIFFTVPLPLGGLPITESQINSALVLLSLFFLCLYLTHGIAEKPNTRRQLLAEWIVEKAEALVRDNMGERFMGFVPFICAILGLSAFSSLLSLLGLFAPTSDVNVVAGWAILVFILITHYKLKGGIGSYLKGFLDPVPIFAPFNVIGEVATPVSMSFRHYGNIMSGMVISVLITSALGGLTNLLLGWLPGFLGDIPFLAIGLPAILSIYFDVFSSCLQAYIFAMLTMLYISNGFPVDAYEERKRKKEAKRQAK